MTRSRAAIALAIAIGLVGCGEADSGAENLDSSVVAETVAVSEPTESTSSPSSTTATPASTTVPATTPAVEPTDPATTTVALVDALIGRRFTVNDISDREIVSGRPIAIYFNDPTNAAIQAARSTMADAIGLSRAA